MSIYDLHGVAGQLAQQWQCDSVCRPGQQSRTLELWSCVWKSRSFQSLLARWLIFAGIEVLTAPFSSDNAKHDCSTHVQLKTSIGAEELGAAALCRDQQSACIWKGHRETESCCHVCLQGEVLGPNAVG